MMSRAGMGTACPCLRKNYTAEEEGWAGHCKLTKMKI